MEKETKERNEELEKQMLKDQSIANGAIMERHAVFQFIQEKFDTIIDSFQNSFENACQSVAEIEQELAKAQERAESAQTYLILAKQLQNFFTQEDYEDFKRIKIKESLDQPEVSEDPAEETPRVRERGKHPNLLKIEQIKEMVDFWQGVKGSGFGVKDRLTLEELEKKVDPWISENLKKTQEELIQEAIDEEKAAIYAEAVAKGRFPL